MKAEIIAHDGDELTIQVKVKITGSLLEAEGAVLDACNEWPAPLQKFFLSWVPPFAEIMLWVAVALTVVSGAVYLWRNRAIYMSDM